MSEFGYANLPENTSYYVPKGMSIFALNEDQIKQQSSIQDFVEDFITKIADKDKTSMGLEGKYGIISSIGVD